MRAGLVPSLVLASGMAWGQEPSPSPSPSPDALGLTLFESATGSLVLRNRAQVRFTHLMPDEDLRLPGTVNPGDGKGSFHVRRAKTELTGWFWRKDLSYELQLSWAGAEPGASTTSPLEDLMFTWDVAGRSRLQLTAGQFKVPLGRQEMTSSHRLQFADRDILDGEFTRGRDVGLMVHGLVSGGRLEYRAGVFNGNPASRPENDNARYQWNGRVTWQPWGDVRYSESDFESAGRPLLAVALQAENNDLHGATNADDLDTRILGADVVFKHHGLFVFAEYFDRRRQPETSRVFASDGFHVQAGYFLVRKRCEVALRYARYDPTSLIPDNDRKELGAALNYFLNGHAFKLQADLRQLEDEGRGTRNRELRVQTQVVFP